MEKLRHYAEWIGLRAAGAWVTRCDFATARARTRRIASIARRVVAHDWLWARRNLQLVFGPQLDPPSLTRLAHVAHEQFFQTCLDAVRCDDLAVQVVDEERLLAALDQGRGVILCTVHLGSWEVATRYLAGRGILLAVVYQKAENPLTDRAIQAGRASQGVEWIEKSGTLRMVRALREGKVLVLMADLETPGGGVVADFLGLEASCAAGPARLALRCGCPIVPAVCLREGEASVTVHAGPAIEPDSRDGGDAAVARLTRQVNAAFEPWVIEYAEQYNWLLPRWRSRAGGGERTLADPIEAQWAERVAPFPEVSERVRRILAES